MKYVLVVLALSTLSACQTTSQPALVRYPVEECGYIREPIYGQLERGASSGEVLSGALVGGLIGSQFGSGDGATAMTALGAIIGGSTVSGNKYVDSVVVGYNEVWRCQTVYK